MGRPTKEQAAAKRAAEEAAARAAEAQAVEEQQQAGEDAPATESSAERPADADSAPPAEEQAGEDAPATESSAIIESERCLSFFEDGQIVLQVEAGRQQVAGAALAAARRLCPELLR